MWLLIVEAQFLTVYFKDTYALIQGFNHTDKSLALKDNLEKVLKSALETQPKGPCPPDIERWRSEVQEFERCWLKVQAGVQLASFFSMLTD